MSCLAFLIAELVTGIAREIIAWFIIAVNELYIENGTPYCLLPLYVLECNSNKSGE